MPEDKSAAEALVREFKLGGVLNQGKPFPRLCSLPAPTSVSNGLRAKLPQKYD